MTYVSTVIADGAVGFWELGEPSGTTATDQTGIKNGTYSGGVTLGQTGIAGGGGATAALFTAASNGAMLALDAVGNRTTDTTTLEAWVKRASTGTVQGIMAGGDTVPSNNGCAYMRFNADDKIHILRAQAADMGASTVTITDTTTFHHIVWTKATSTNKIYIDGVDVTGTITNGTLTQSHGWGVGCDSSHISATTFESFNGTIAMAAVYPTALSAATVLAHYNLGNPTLFVPAPNVQHTTLAVTRAATR